MIPSRKLKVNKFFVVILLIVSASSSVTFPLNALDGSSVYVTALSAVIMEPESGKILFSKAPHLKQPPASTAKVTTALIVLDTLSLDRRVHISPVVEGVQSSKLYLKGGEELSVRDLLKAVLMKSANDAAMALAIEVAGSEHAFAELMNQKARKLGAQNTHFVNSTGLPGRGQYSTTYDLALIMNNAMKNHAVASILKERHAVIQTSNGRRYYLKNHNKMLWRGRGIFGKTGYTRRARHCFVGWIEGQHNDAVIAVLGSHKLWDDLTSLANRRRGIDRNRESKIFSYGSRGDEVKSLQLGLKKAGFFKGPVTGYFGKQTKLAVIKFQKAKGLPADGMIGSQTQKALSSFL